MKARGGTRLAVFSCSKIYIISNTSVDSAIQGINHQTLDKYYQNLLRYPVDSAIHPLMN